MSCDEGGVLETAAPVSENNDLGSRRIGLEKRAGRGSWALLEAGCIRNFSSFLRSYLSKIELRISSGLSNLGGFRKTVFALPS